MHASIKHTQSAFETKVLAMENGFNTFPVPNADLNFGKEVLAPKDVVQRFAGYVTLIRDVQTTEEAHQAAVRACEKAMPAAHAFYEEAVTVVKAHFGSDPQILATFGLGKPRKATRPVGMLVIEKVVMPPKQEVVAVEEVVLEEPAPSEVEGPPAARGEGPERTSHEARRGSRREPKGKGGKHPHSPKAGRGQTRPPSRG